MKVTILRRFHLQINGVAIGDDSGLGFASEAAAQAVATALGHRIKDSDKTVCAEAKSDPAFDCVWWLFLNGLPVPGLTFSSKAAAYKAAKDIANAFHKHLVVRKGEMT